MLGIFVCYSWWRCVLALMDLRTKGADANVRWLNNDAIPITNGAIHP